MFRTWLIFLAVVAAPLALLQGQGKVSFEASSDARQIIRESYVDVSFTLSNADGSNFQPPAFKDFIVISGPSRSVRTSIINGQVSKEESYIYTLQPRRLGKLAVGSASIRVKGQTMRSKPLTIEVVESRSGSGQEVFILAEPSTKQAWAGQQIILDYKLYTTVNVESFNILEEAEYQGFYAQDIRRYNGRIIREVVNGVQYVTKILKRVALFPQQAGSLNITPMNVQIGIVKDDSRRRGFFYTPEVKRVPVNTEPVAIKVSPLPANPPPSFSGGVGEFSMATMLNRTTVTTDDALSLRITISGSGDIKRVQAPPLEAPSEFELYDPKVAEEASYEDGQGITGKKVFEYLLLPKEAGKFQLRPVFSYFNPDLSRYVTIGETVYDITVRPGSGRRPAAGPGTAEKKEDINYLMMGQKLYRRQAPFPGSALFWLLALLPGLALGIIIAIRRWRAHQAAIDPTVLRSRHARKAAEQRLATARQHLASNSTRAFYDEVSKAMLGYVCDKLHIPRSSLSKDMLRHRLEQLQLDAGPISRFLNIIQTCEMALFAGQEDAAAMQGTYQDAVQVLSDIEGQIKVA